MQKVLLGSVLWILINWIVVGATPDAKLMEVWHHILRIYREDEVQNRFGSLKMTMFTTKSSPKLKGKAAEVRDLVPVLHKVWHAISGCLFK